MSRGRRYAWASALALVTAISAGCAGGPDVSNCEVPGCEPGCQSCTDGDGHRWSSDWYASRACDPVGSRQKCKHGKMWPPYPRPTGPRQQFMHRYHAAHYWPWPYVCQDRAYVKHVANAQIANGWSAETTLYDYHFDPDTQELTHAGRAHLAWILREIPPQRRVAFVQRTYDSTTTAVRMDNVQVVAHEIVGSEKCPPIVPTDATPIGTPAEYNDAIQRAIRDTIPEPRIQYTPVPTGVGGGA